MSLRSAVRIVARPRALPAVRTSVPRRFASTHKSAGSGNATWAAGSAVIFGGLATFILLPSEKKDHVAHQQHPHEPKAPGEVQFTSQEMTDEVKNSHVEDLAKKNKGTVDYEDVDEAKKKGLEDSKSSDGDSKASGKGSDAGGEKGSSKDATGSESSDGYEPSRKEINASIVRGERTDAPPVAEAEEEKGSDVQAKKSTSSESSGDYEPSQKEITASIVRGERTDAPPIAEAEEEKGIDVQAKKD